MTLKAPFPWFGGKSRVAHLVWPRFGDVLNYVEPFAGSLAVLLARPYGDTRQDGLYAVDSLTVADEVRAWCVAEIEDGKFKGPRFAHPQLRIALCGLDGEHNDLEGLGWDVVAWKANGGYGNQRADGSNGNSGRERIWFSPNCLTQDFGLNGIVDTRNYDDLFSGANAEGILRRTSE